MAARTKRTRSRAPRSISMLIFTATVPLSGTGPLCGSIPKVAEGGPNSSPRSRSAFLYFSLLAARTTG
jgi:hypothetical protein